MQINPVKGTHDIINEDSAIYQSLDMMSKILSNAYCYQYISTPIIEHTNLFQRSVGESSDIVNKEMYTFLDKGGRSLTLRPEMTAGVMRSVVTNKLYANADLPLRYYYFGPCFRYERPQAGRYRQFHQFGVELIGAKTCYDDIEVMFLGNDYLKSLGLDEIQISINTLGDEKTRENYKNALKEYFAKYIDNMCEDCKRRYQVNPLRILDCKVPEDKEIVKNAPRIRDYLSDEAKLYFNQVISILDEYKINYIIDDNLVRGLDYYTGIVFEYHLNSLPQLGAIGGGGHYKNLLKEVGGPDLEGVGLSIGIERVSEAIKSIHSKDELVVNQPHFYVMCLNENCLQAGFMLATGLRKHGFIVEQSYEIKSFKAQFKTAERKRCIFAIIIGDDEVKAGTVKVKNLKTQEQTDISAKDAFKVLTSMVSDYEAEEEEKREENNE